MIQVTPITIRNAMRFVAEHHRHNKPPVGALFAASVTDDFGETRAVAMVGRPIARHLDDGFTCEVIRLASDGCKNACSMLYAASARAAAALGYESIITYILEQEPGTSLIAAGWTQDADVPAAKTWSCSSRPRYTNDLFGNPIRPECAKVRYRKRLNKRVSVLTTEHSN